MSCYTCSRWGSQIVGIHQRAGDLKVNVCRQKQLTNMRSAGARRDDESLSPFPARLLDLSWTPRRRREERDCAAISPLKSTRTTRGPRPPAQAWTYWLTSVLVAELLVHAQRRAAAAATSPLSSDTSTTRPRRGGHGTPRTRPRHARDTSTPTTRPWHVRGRRAPPPERALEKPRLRAHLLTGGPADTAPEQGAGCVRAADDAEDAEAPEAAAVDAAAAATAPSAAAVEEDTSRGGEARASGGAKLAFDAAGGVVALVAIACSSAIFAAMPALPRPGPSATNATAL